MELDLEELKSLARTIGFEISVSSFRSSNLNKILKKEYVNLISKNERMIDTTYTNNAQSMLGYVYHASFFTATKIKVN